jgi:hypothetical protein
VLSFLITGGDIISYTFCGIFLLSIIGVQLYRELYKTVPIREIMLLILVLQCVFVPAVVYENDYFLSVKMDMPISANFYFSYVLPATIAYIIGLYFKKKKYNIPIIINSSNYVHKGWMLLFVGIIADFVPLGFFSFLLSLLKYVGMFYLLFSTSRYKYLAVILLLLSLVYHSLVNAMFHDLLINAVFFFFILNLKKKMSKLMIVTCFIFGIGLFVGVQTVKPLLREKLWYGGNTIKDKNEVIYQTVVNADISDGVLTGYAIRLNQGWHISRVMNYIPKYNNYGVGESYVRSITSSLLPRFLKPNKAEAGGVENMKRYTGINLVGWSTDIGIMGEPYGNFGYFGIIAMFLIGFLFSEAIHVVEKKAQLKPELLFWLPFLFYQVIKAESSSITVFNHLAKSALVVWFIFSKYSDLVPFLNEFRINRMQNDSTI